jgi:hypothetical protein
MQDVKEAEPDSVGALAALLDAELEYHERAAEELRRVRQNWSGAGTAAPAPMRSSPPPRPSRRNSLLSRTNTSRSWQEPHHNAVYEESEPAVPPRMPIRSAATSRAPPPPPQPARPTIGRSATSYDSRSNTLTPRGSMTPLARIATDSSAYSRDDVFSDDASTVGSGSAGSDHGDRSASPATSYGSLSRTSSAMGTIGKKAPPPPPPNRAKKPAPPVPRREAVGY